jgi:transcriptional regulator with XRE-family HTH domain
MLSCVAVARSRVWTVGQQLAESLREWRRVRGWTQEQLAERAGVDRPRVAKLESGKSQAPRRGTIHKLANAFGISTEELLDGPPNAGYVDGFLARLSVEMHDHGLSDNRKIALALRELATTLERAASPSRPSESVIRDGDMLPSPSGLFLPFEVPPDKFIEADYDYPQTYRGGETGLLGAAAAGPFEDIDTTGETADVLNPTLRDVQSGRFGVIKVKGDSMFPRLKDGDLVLIDTFDKEPKPKRIMAVYRRGEGSTLGYVHRIGDLTIVTKANPAYAPLILPEDSLIQGVVKKRLEEALE